MKSGRRVLVYLDSESHAKAKMIGKGNTSRGIRERSSKPSEPAPRKGVFRFCAHRKPEATGSKPQPLV